MFLKLPSVYLAMLRFFQFKALHFPSAQEIVLIQTGTILYFLKFSFSFWNSIIYRSAFIGLILYIIFFL